MGVIGRIFILLAVSAWAAPGRAMEVTDALGRTTAIPTPVQRIVALNSDALEILRVLKAQDRVVGVYAEIVREPEFWGELVDLPKAGGWRTPNLEAIAALSPDLVIVYSRNPGDDFGRKMGALGIPVLRLDFYRLDTLESEVRTLGRLLAKDAEAVAFCRWHGTRLGALQRRVARMTRRPAVYVESYSDFTTTGPGSGADGMCRLAGGRNIAGDLQLPYPKITPEWVVAREPEVIVKAASRANGYRAADARALNAEREAILNRPVWSEIPAVKAGRVHVMDSAVWTGPRALTGIAWLARWFFPEAFSDIDPESWHKDYFEIFQAIPYQGVYVSEAIKAETR